MRVGYFLLVLSASFSLSGCIGKKAIIKQEPVPEVILKKIDPVDQKLHLNDSARSSDFNQALKKISKITIRYDGPSSESLIWKNSLEKNLLRMGILITEEAKKDPLFDSDDESREIRSDAVLVIDKISLLKIDSGKSSEGFIDKNFSDYTFSFFVAEINGKIILKNGDVVWNSRVSISSFDLLKIAEAIQPEILFRKSSKHRYSEKLGEWIQDGWTFSAGDNFQSKFMSSFDESRHKADLIDMAVSGFIGNIKSGNIVSGR